VYFVTFLRYNTSIQFTRSSVAKLRGRNPRSPGKQLRPGGLYL